MTLSDISDICERKLQLLLQLEKNWDSYMGEPITQESVDRARTLLEQSLSKATPEPAIVPTNRGGVQLEWSGGGIEVEIEIEPSAQVCIFCDVADPRKAVLICQAVCRALEVAEEQ